MPMARQLVFDIGMHRGEDTAFYLARGHQVVAVDANPTMVAEATERFADAIAAGQLRLVHCAVGPDEGEVDFHLSEETLWSSLATDIPSRWDRQVTRIRVPSRRLSGLIAEYGVPVYLKIDVEGFDAVCLSTLDPDRSLPPHVSVETECTGDRARLGEHEALETLRQLTRLGYRRFKLVDQRSLAVVEGSGPFYYAKLPRWRRVLRRLGVGRALPGEYFAWATEEHGRAAARGGFPYPDGATGPFGEELGGRWLDAREAEAVLLARRREFFALPDVPTFAFWCDWHAAR